MKGAGLSRIRRTGCHAKCTECELYKKDLRTGTLSMQARAQTMERYTAHIVEQWLDRQPGSDLFVCLAGRLQVASIRAQQLCVDCHCRRHGPS